MKHIYEKLAKSLAEKNLKARIIAVGRSALELYGIEAQYTQDIDFELIAEDEVWKDLEAIIEGLEVRADYGESFDRWSVVPMPEGYRERAKCVMKFGKVEVCVLDPVDYVIGKLRRGTVEDEEDARLVIKRFGIKKEEIARRLELIKPVKDIEYFLFRKRMESFLAGVS